MIASARRRKSSGSATTGTFWRVSFSISFRYGRSSSAQKAIASPLAPARAVRPMRWTYCSGTLGSSKLKTWLTPDTSMPRAAMSVATRIGTSPDLNSASARSRCGWLLLPWIALAATPLPASSFTTRSAPCLVRVNTSARSMGMSFTSIVSSACFSCWLQKITDWSTRSAVVDCGTTLTVAGSVRNWSASWRIDGGMVAEKNSVWRLRGSMRTIFLSAWMKPRSSIWSASSSTRISIIDRLR